jgi:hypothetical protein
MGSPFEFRLREIDPSTIRVWPPTMKIPCENNLIDCSGLLKYHPKITVRRLSDNPDACGGTKMFRHSVRGSISFDTSGQALIVNGRSHGYKPQYPFALRYRREKGDKL